MVGAGAETFALLGNETRLRIIEALGDLSEPGEFSTVSFSELRTAVGVSDSGTFSYHLRKLTGRFVTSVDEGYRLSLEGINVYRGLRAGIFTADGDGIDSAVVGKEVPTTIPCEACGEPMRIWIEDGRPHYGCVQCAEVHIRYPVPAGGLHRAAEHIADGDGDDAYGILRRRIVFDYLSMLGGACPYCSGRTSVQLSAETEHVPRPESATLGLVATLTCSYCHWYLHGNLETALCYHPQVVPFLQQRGIDPFVRDPLRDVVLDATVRSTEPWRIEASAVADDDRLVLELDGELTAQDTRLKTVTAED
jgi:DNA-binding transcriptional ArsR family regulator